MRRSTTRITAARVAGGREYHLAQRVELLLALPSLSQRATFVLIDALDAKLLAEPRKNPVFDLVESLFLLLQLSLAILDFLLNGVTAAFSCQIAGAVRTRGVP